MVISGRWTFPSGESMCPTIVPLPRWLLSLGDRLKVDPTTLFRQIHVPCGETLTAELTKTLSCSSFFELA